MLREQLAYALLNFVTPQSFRARLARATYVDAKNGKTVAARYAIFIEHENDVARRLGGRIVELPRLTFKDVDAAALNNMMLFNYMIGNTDFSLYTLHNVRVVQDRERTLFTVPYDFDLSGFVSPPYAIPDRRLGTDEVARRRRGQRRGDVLHERHHRQPEGRRLLPPIDVPALDGHDVRRLPRHPRVRRDPAGRSLNRARSSDRSWTDANRILRCNC